MLQKYTPTDCFFGDFAYWVIWNDPNVYNIIFIVSHVSDDRKIKIRISMYVSLHIMRRHKRFLYGDYNGSDESSPEDLPNCKNIRFKKRYALPVIFLAVVGIIFFENNAFFHYGENVEVRFTKRQQMIHVNFSFLSTEQPQRNAKCFHLINIYIQFVLENIENYELINDICNLIYSIVHKTACQLKFYILVNDNGRDVINHIFLGFKDRLKWFKQPTIVYLDYYEVAKKAVMYTKPMKVCVYYIYIYI